ncbi:MAG: XRE family transcriptional regulator [Acidobacteriota bacterium]
MSTTWPELGERVVRARRAAGFTQSDLAAAVGMDRTAISKIENGDRRVDSLELGRIAEILKRPVSWFLTTPIPAVISRRQAREGIELAADILLETLATDVEQLVEMGLLSPVRPPQLDLAVESVESAESAAIQIRNQLQPDGALLDLARLAEQLGLYVFVLELEPNVEGSYLALEAGGVALVQGRDPSGKRRFTIAHELGHHVLADEYSSDWITGDRDERERLISAFAIHLLLPRSAVLTRWRQLDGDSDPWNATIHLAAEYGVSWSAVCAQLRNLRLVDEETRRALTRRRPVRADYLERMLGVPAEPPCPAVPPGFAAAVIKGYRRHLLGRERALELLRGTLAPDGLPEQHEVPLEAMLDELEPV